MISSPLWKNKRVSVLWLVGGLERDFFICPFSWECHHSSWRTHISQWARSTTNQISIYIYLYLFIHIYIYIHIVMWMCLMCEYNVYIHRKYIYTNQDDLCDMSIVEVKRVWTSPRTEPCLGMACARVWRHASGVPRGCTWRIWNTQMSVLFIHPYQCSHTCIAYSFTYVSIYIYIHVFF